MINVEAKADLEAFFTGGPQGLGARRYWPYRNDEHGCKDHVADLESSYKEAAEASLVCQPGSRVLTCSS